MKSCYRPELEITCPVWRHCSASVRAYLWLLLSMCIYQWLLVIHTFRERKPLVGAGFLPTLPGTTRGKTMRPNLSLSLLISCRPSYKPIRGGLLITPSDGHLNITDPPPPHSQTPHTVLSVLNYVAYEYGQAFLRTLVEHRSHSTFMYSTLHDWTRSDL